MSDSFKAPEEGEGARHRRNGLVPCGKLCLSAARCRSSPDVCPGSGLCLYCRNRTVFTDAALAGRVVKHACFPAFPGGGHALCHEACCSGACLSARGRYALWGGRFEHTCSESLPETILPPHRACRKGPRRSACGSAAAGGKRLQQTEKAPLGRAEEGRFPPEGEKLYFQVGQWLTSSGILVSLSFTDGLSFNWQDVGCWLR